MNFKLLSIVLLGVVTLSNAEMSNTEKFTRCEEKLQNSNERIATLQKIIASQTEVLKMYRKPGGKKQKNTSASKKSNVNLQKTVKDAYFKKIKINKLKAKYSTNLINQQIPGVDFTLKNNGDRILSQVEITVYFLDKNGDPIHEEIYTPVNSDLRLGATKPLKPKYVWRVERGYFLPAKSVPSEWKVGKVKAEITNVEFYKK